MKILITHGVDINVKSKDHKTPLSIAEEKNLRKIRELLISHGAKTNKCSI